MRSQAVDAFLLRIFYNKVRKKSCFEFKREKFMFDIANPHQFFQTNDDDNVMICRWTMDKIDRQDGQVWVMNHFFINPNANKVQILDKEMGTAIDIAQKSNLPIWPLDPMIIDYFAEHPEFANIWYHKPVAK